MKTLLQVTRLLVKDSESFSFDFESQRIVVNRDDYWFKVAIVNVNEKKISYFDSSNTQVA